MELDELNGQLEVVVDLGKLHVPTCNISEIGFAGNSLKILILPGGNNI